jgi:xanthine dehydrogenase YagS FAD-binding subunit
MQNFELSAATGHATLPQGGAYIAGGTDMLQLMKANIAAPTHVMDLAGQNLRGIHADEHELRLGALETMADVAAHPQVRKNWPAISQALLLSASPQVRNMSTMGGNLLQRTRCLYFRDTAFACNKRNPGSGCPAIAGENRELAILGGSEHCIATHPSDFPVALMALGANVSITAPDGSKRSVPLAEFYRLPGDTPHIETILQNGEIISEIIVPASAMARQSGFLHETRNPAAEYVWIEGASVAGEEEVCLLTISTEEWACCFEVGADP